MKFFVATILLSSIAAIWASDPSEKYLETRMHCMLECKVGDEMMAKAMLGEPIEDPKIQEMALCMMKKMHWMDDKGELQMDHIKEKMTAMMAATMEHIMAKCMIKMATPAETAMHTMRCMKKAKIMTWYMA